MYEFSSSELDQIVHSVQSIEQDMNSLGALIDSASAPLPDQEKFDRLFNSFSARIYAKINFLKGILFSKDFILDL